MTISMNELELYDPVRIQGTETIYEGLEGELTSIRDVIGVETHGVFLPKVDGRRWFSPGELVKI